MAAAAYGEEQDINQCLNSTFAEARVRRIFKFQTTIQNCSLFAISLFSVKTARTKWYVMKSG